MNKKFECDNCKTIIGYSDFPKLVDYKQTSYFQIVFDHALPINLTTVSSSKDNTNFIYYVCNSCW